MVDLKLESVSLGYCTAPGVVSTYNGIGTGTAAGSGNAGIG